MVVGGENDAQANLADVEVIDLNSPIVIPCYKPNNIPIATQGLVGTFINGLPIVCGGRHTNNCYGYENN